jgi:hypothetical protein
MNAKFKTSGINLLTVLAGIVLLMSSCRNQSPAKTSRAELGWRPIASWTGRGNTQTDSFNIGSGQWRIKWATTHEQAPGKGAFRLKVHSLVSGRFVQTAVDYRGEGHDTAYVAEEPRAFFLVIDSHDIDWSVSVEEGVIGEADDSR